MYQKILKELLMKIYSVSIPYRKMSLYINRIFSNLFFGHSPFEDIFVTANQFDNA